jgi:glyceraldehyde 3-phosphate dehydrogenase
MLPASTGAALATTKALPGLAGRFDGVAIRVPVPAGSIADVTAVITRSVTREEVNDAFRGEASGDRYRGISGSPATRWSPPTSSATRGPRWWTRR